MTFYDSQGGSPGRTGSGQGVYVSGNYAFLTEDDRVADDNRVLVIDISTPSQPTVVGSYDNAGWGAWAWQVFVMDNLAYVADSWSGLLILEVDTPAPLHLNPPIRSGDKLGVKVQ